MDQATFLYLMFYMLLFFTAVAFAIMVGFEIWFQIYKAKTQPTDFVQRLQNGETLSKENIFQIKRKGI